MTMDNRISTTIIHQAVTSKGHTPTRAKVIRTILQSTPMAASIRNGYGSLPLHVITQRNTKMDAKTKEGLILLLIEAYPAAIVQPGGVGKRTPLHIAFTDYISPNLARAMIQSGLEAAKMRDRKGWLPVHVACSRHCSPEKLRLLLSANPTALTAKTDEGETLMDLARRTATRTHPNFALMTELAKQMHVGPHNLIDFGVTNDNNTTNNIKEEENAATMTSMVDNTTGGNDSRYHTFAATMSTPATPSHTVAGTFPFLAQRGHFPPMTRMVKDEDRGEHFGSRLSAFTRLEHQAMATEIVPSSNAAASLLLHFSHGATDETSSSQAEMTTPNRTNTQLSATPVKYPTTPPLVSTDEATTATTGSFENVTQV